MQKPPQIINSQWVRLNAYTAFSEVHHVNNFIDNIMFTVDLGSNKENCIIVV